MEASVCWQLVTSWVLFITFQQVYHIKVWMWPCHTPTNQHFWNKAKTISQPTRSRLSYSQPPPPQYTTSLLILHLYWDPFWSPRAISPPTRESLHILNPHLDLFYLHHPHLVNASLVFGSHITFCFFRNVHPKTSDCYALKSIGLLFWWP